MPQAEDLPSPASSRELFEKLAIVAPVTSDPSDSEFSFSWPNVERTSSLAGQDRLSEFMLEELPLLNLDPNV